MLKSNIILGMLLIVTGLSFSIFRIKRNYFLGYRTPRSMSDSESWEFANRLASRYMIGIGLVTIFLDVLNYFIFQVNFVYITALTIGLLMVTIIWIEWKLWLRQRKTS